MVKWHPLRDKLIIKVTKVDRMSSGGIALLETSQEREDMAKEEGIILAVGQDIFGDTPESRRDILKPGMYVAFARYGGKALGKDEENNELRVMRDIDILAIKTDDQEAIKC